MSTDFCAKLTLNVEEPYYYLSDYFDGFREIGKEFSIDLAIINLGAHAPRWLMVSNHMNPAETVQAFKELSARICSLFTGAPFVWGMIRYISHRSTSVGS